MQAVWPQTRDHQSAYGSQNPRTTGEKLLVNPEWPIIKFPLELLNIDYGLTKGLRQADDGAFDALHQSTKQKL